MKVHKFKYYADKSYEENEKVLRKKYEDRLKDGKEFIVRIAFIPEEYNRKTKSVEVSLDKIEFRDYELKINSLEELNDEEVIKNIKHVIQYYGKVKYLYIIEKNISYKVGPNLAETYLAKIEAEKYNL